MKHSIQKRLTGLLCALALTLSLAPAASAAPTYRDSGATDMAKLTKAEIAALLEQDQSDPGEPFVQAPSITAPYAAGKVSGEVLRRGLDRLNALRRLAGVPAVTLDESLCELTQYGAVVIAANNTLSHSPARPAGMEDAFYQKGVQATGSSNLSMFSWRTESPVALAVGHLMRDESGSNLTTLGHRRWQLNPTMGKVGFGYARSATGSSYVVEYSFDRSGAGCDYDYISWPASGNFPNDLFEVTYPWSVTLNPEKYADPDRSDLTVTLVRESDGKRWQFSGSDYNTSDRLYFGVNNAGYGVSNCIIFRPDEVEAYEGVYTVTISGLRSAGGSAVDFAYQVDFFDSQAYAAGETGPETTPTPTPAPQPTTPGDTVLPITGSTFSTGLAVKEDGTLVGWGHTLEEFGQTWNGEPVALGSGYTAVWGGPFEHYLLKEDGTLWYCGDYNAAFFDDGTTMPVKIMDNVAQFNNGTVLKQDGTVWCEIPAQFEDYTTGRSEYWFYYITDNAKQVSGTMALKTDGSLWSWGDNQDGSLGRAAGQETWNSLGKVMDDVAEVSGTLALKTDGSLWSWGSNYFGAVGNGGDDNQSVPVKIMDNVTGAWTGGGGMMSTKFALTGDGSLYSWGYNSCGQLGYSGGNGRLPADRGSGTPEIAYQTTPKKVDFSGTESVYATHGTLLVRKTDGSLWGAGSNVDGVCNVQGKDFLDGFVQILTGVKAPEAADEGVFTDVPADAWYAPYVSKAAAAGLVNGVGDGRFEPMSKLTLGSVVALAARLHAERAGATVPSASGAWYQGAYDYCTENGLFTAEEVPLSAMDVPATRYQMVDLLDRAVPEGEKAAVKTVADGAIPDLREADAYGPVVYRWYRAGIVEGDGAGCFNGGSDITRAEMATILCRLAGLTGRA